MKLISIIILLFLSACTQSGTEPESQVMTCEEYCPTLPHVMCVGEWKINGTYPDCECAYECYTQEGPDCVTQSEFDNAENEGKCWVLVDGWVYDLTNTPKELWGLGMLHMGRHSCGEDLSEAINQSPHGPGKIVPYKYKELC